MMLFHHDKCLVSVWCLAAVLAGVRPDLQAADWPMLGRDGTRNGVSSERGAPTLWSIEQREGDHVIRAQRCIRWSATLGWQTHSSPVVSAGLIWIGTSHHYPGTPGNFNDEHAVLKCFRVADGKQIYEYDSPRRSAGIEINDPGWTGLGSSPLIEGDHLWLATNRSEVLCLDIGPLVRSEGVPRELWKLDMLKKFDLFPHVPIMGPPRPCSIGPSWQGQIFVTTNNGTSRDHTEVPKPDAPSLVCLDKETGEVYWTDNSPGPNILVSQFASPTVASIHGEVQVIVPQGDGWVRSFDPKTGNKLWEFDVNPKEAVYTPAGRGDRNSLLGNAVVYEDHVYLASGQDAICGEGSGRLVCIDPTKRGDVSSELAVDADNKPLPRRRVQAVDPKAGEKAIPNPNSALVWHYSKYDQNGDGKVEFEETMHRTCGTTTITNGLLVIPDYSGLVHCVDAKTGKPHWTHDLFAATMASALIVEDKAYIGDEEGKVTIFRLSPEKEVIAEIDMGNSVYSSPIFANGALYLATKSKLFAMAADKNEPAALTDAGVASAGKKARTLRSVFVPTPQDVVEKMLELAKPKKTDLVYDLGSGDGRIVITAANKYGCRAVGYELDKELVELSRAKAEAAGVSALVTVDRKDLFTADLRGADVIMLFLLPQQLEKLLPQLQQLRPGARIVSHEFEIPGVKPDQVLTVESQTDGNRHHLHLWTAPFTKLLGSSGATK